jgi:hypothetical protein
VRALCKANLRPDDITHLIILFLPWLQKMHKICVYFFVDLFSLENLCLAARGALRGKIGVFYAIFVDTFFRSIWQVGTEQVFFSKQVQTVAQTAERKIVISIRFHMGFLQAI